MKSRRSLSLCYFQAVQKLRISVILLLYLCFAVIYNMLIYFRFSHSNCSPFLLKSSAKDNKYFNKLDKTFRLIHINCIYF